MNFSRIALALAAAAAVALPASAESWKSIGKGIFRENFLHCMYNISQYPEIEVDLEESEETPGRYRMVNPYKNFPDFIGSPGCYEGDYYIIVDASDPVHCYIPTCKSGYQWGGSEMMIVGSIADDYYNNRYGDWTLADEENRCGKLEDGAITFPAGALLAASWNPDTPWDDDLLWKQCNGRFRLKLPGAPDIDITANLEGINDAKTELIFDVTLGASIDRALVALVKGEESEEMADKVVSGEIPSVEITENGTVNVPYTEDGFFTIVVVPYYDGNRGKAFTKTLEVVFDESQWRKAGKAFYREGIISAVEDMIPYGFVYPMYEYYVDVEENVEKPGYIRLVDPYGDACPLLAGCEYDYSRRWYLYVDASDPDRVVIERAEGIGLDLGYGRMDIWSKAHRLMDNNDPVYVKLWKDNGYDDSGIESLINGFVGTFCNDEITFPISSISLSFHNVRPGTWYTANSDQKFSIRFEPGQILGKQSTAVETIGTDNTDAPALYYRLDGTQADADTLAPGLYIVRKGTESYKTVIR